MKAALLREVRSPLVIEDVQISKPGPHEALLRTAASGVCHSDLHFIEGAYPYALPVILGHESAGVVEQVGSEVRTVKPGDHVITCPSAFCGHCEHCLTGHMSLCINPETRRDKKAEPRLSEDSKPVNQFTQLSSFAEQMLIHEHACVAIRKDIRVNSIHPALIKTPMTETNYGVGIANAATDMMLNMHPIGRFATPGDVAACVLFLASKESNFFTGSEMVADGGMTAERATRAPA